MVVKDSTLFCAFYGHGVFTYAPWAAKNNGLGQNFAVSGMCADNTNLFLASGGGGVFLSTDHANSWAAVNTGLAGAYVTEIITDSTNVLVGSAYTGVYHTANNGAMWTNLGLATPGGINSLAIAGNKVYAGTAKDGIFIHTLFPTGIAETKGNKNFINVYPNPTLGKVTISSTFANSEVQVFDAIGNQVFETQKNGNSFELKLGFLNKGHYFIRLKEGSKIATAKITIE
jgi:hypothetical protein